MSFYESLDVFVGAGLLAVAPAVGSPVPPGGVGAGTGLSAFLRERGDGSRFGEILDRLAQEVWLSRDTHGIAVEQAEKHAVALVPILEEIRPAPHELATALNAPTDEKPGRAAAIAADVVFRAIQQDLLAPAGLHEHIAGFMLERLFQQLISDPPLLASLEPMIAAYAAGTSCAARNRTAEKVLPLEVDRRSSESEAPPSHLPGPARDTLPAPIAEPDPLYAAALSVRTRYGIGEAVTARFTGIVEQQGLKVEAIPARLEELAIWLQVTTTQLAKPSNDEPEVRRMKLEAAEALAAGAFERAMDRLKEVRSALRGQRRRTQERLEDEIHQLKLQQIEEAGACARLAELAFARGDYDSAIDLFAEAADSVPTSEPMLRLNYALRQADTLFRKGETVADTLALTAAADHYRRALATAEHHKNRELTIAARCALGDTLSLLGQHESDTCNLRDAVKIWRVALAAMDKAREPRRIASVYNALGDALFCIAKRDGDENAIDLAAEAYGEAVKLLSTLDMQLDCAFAQLGRGTCLLRIAERDGKDSLWLDAAAALVPALEILEAEGLGEVGRHARENLRSFHANWSRLLERTSRPDEGATQDATEPRRRIAR